MSDDSKKLGNVVQIDEGKIRDHLGELVRGTVEETLNAMLGAEIPHARNPGCTVDLFAHENVERTLGRDELSDAVYKALVDSRMRVLPHHVGWVITLVGHGRAATCTSLSRHVRDQFRSRIA